MNSEKQQRGMINKGRRLSSEYRGVGNFPLCPVTAPTIYSSQFPRYSPLSTRFCFSLSRYSLLVTLYFRIFPPPSSLLSTHFYFFPLVTHYSLLSTFVSFLLTTRYYLLASGFFPPRSSLPSTRYY